ncbi:20140_t:CDS:2, partial [Gigaspora margarita]
GCSNDNWRSDSFYGMFRFIPPTIPIKNSIRVYNLSAETVSLSLSLQLSTNRAGHVAVIIGDQIVFMGGSHFIPPTNPIKNSIRVYNLSDEVFSLSLSSQFSTSNPSFADLSDTSARMKFGSEKGTAVLGGPSGVNVYLIGGVQQNLTRFNEIDNKSNITSNQPLTIEEINKTYNMTNQSTQPGVDADLIDMNEIPVFDTISSTWSYKAEIQVRNVQPV